MALRFREISKAQCQSYPDILDVTSSEIPRVIQKINTKLLIHGHTHNPVLN